LPLGLHQRCHGFMVRDGFKISSERIAFVTVLFLKQNVEEGDGFIV